MSSFPLASGPSCSPTCAAARVAVLIVLGACVWGGTGGGADAWAQDTAGPCADTLATAEKIYRNRNYQEAISLASQCTDQQEVGEDTAIRAYRLITLASLRQGTIARARSAVTNILRIDPEYTADPVNDPPSYDLLVSMVREEVLPQATADTEADTTRDPEADADTTRIAEADRTEEEDPGATQVMPAQSQPGPMESGFFLKFGGGLSDYTGDHPFQTSSHPFDFQEFITGSGFPFVASVELGYQMSPDWAVLVGFQVGNYPIVGFGGGTGNASDTDRYTPQFLVRYTFRNLDRTVRPYIDFGGNVTFGGEASVSTGYGPSLGGGLSIALGRVTSLYVESRFNFTFPDDAVDAGDFGEVGFGGRPFDSVNQLLGVGIRVDLGGG